MSIITTVPKIGQRVTANTIPGNYGEYEGKVAVVTRVESDAIYGEFASIQKPDDTISLAFTDWSPVRNPMVAKGDKIKAINVFSVPHANGQVCTVIRGVDDGASEVYCKFDTYTDRDGIERPETEWYVHEWEQVFPEDQPITFETKDRMIGKTVKIIYSSGTHNAGKIGKVIETYYNREDSRYGPKVDGITVRIDTHPSWVQAYEVIEDGQTLTVSDADEYVPEYGDHVVMTGYLTDDGINDRVTMRGVVRAVENGVWTVDVDGVRYVSGPGYVAKAPAVNEEPVVLETDIVPAPRQDEIDRLEARIASLEEQNRILTQRVTDWMHDFETYAESVVQESVDRDWCDEYERVMGRVQDKLRVATIPAREQEYEIEVSVSGTASTTYTVTVSAVSQEAAEDMVKDDMDSYFDAGEVLSDAVRYGGGWDDVDTEIE